MILIPSAIYIIIISRAIDKGTKAYEQDLKATSTYSEKSNPIFFIWSRMDLFFLTVVFR